MSSYQAVFHPTNDVELMGVYLWNAHVCGAIYPLIHGVVAKTEFSTWQFLLDPEFLGRGLIWPKQLGKVFAGQWPSTQGSTVLAFAHDLVATLRDFRNRIFHHEPAWKRFGVVTESDAIQHLLEKVTKIEDLLTLIHPENVNLLQKNGTLRVARRACSSGEIRRFNI